MKALLRFLDYHVFFKDKIVEVTAVRDWKEYKTENILGTNIEVAVVEDNTKYPTNNGEQFSNVHEKFTMKVPKDIKSKLKIGDRVEAVNPVATIYGKFNENLSVRCDDVTVINPQPAPNAHTKA